MNEIIFLVEDALEGGLTAKALSFPIFTDADDFESLKMNIRDAVACHFDDQQQRIIRIHYVKEETFAA